MTRPAPFTALKAYSREVEAEQAVKPKERGLTAGQLGDDQHHRSPGEHVAYSGGRAPAPPNNPDARVQQLREAIGRRLRVVPDQQEPGSMSSNSYRGDHCKELERIGCPTPKRLYCTRRADGRRVVLELPCKRRSCSWCGGDHRAQRLARDVAHAIGTERLWLLAGPAVEVAKLQRRKALRGHLVAHVPTPDDGRALLVNTPFPGAVEVDDLPSLLVGLFAAQPNDGRRYWLAPAFQRVVGDVKAERKATFQESYEVLGEVAVSLDKVEEVARDLDVLAARTPVAVVLKPMPNIGVEMRFRDAVVVVRRRWGWAA